MLFLTGRSQLPGELQCGHGICMMVGQMDTLSLLSLKEMKAHLWQFHQGEKKKKRKKKEGKKRKAKGFQRRQPLERFPTIKEKGLQHVLLIWYLCSPTPCLQACSLQCTKGSYSPMDSSVSTCITCLPLWLPHAVTSDQSKFILYRKWLLRS